MRYFKSLILACQLLMAGRSLAQENIFTYVPNEESRVKITATALFSDPPQAGFLPVRVEIENGTPKEFDITLKSESNGEFYAPGNSNHSTFEIPAAAGQTTARDILVPLTPSSLGYKSQRVSLKMSSPYGLAEGSLNSKMTDENRPDILLSESLFSANASKLDAELKSSSSYSRGYGSTAFAGEFDPKMLPENWLAYSGYDVIGMTDHEWTSLNPGPKSAIKQWLRLGGKLHLFSQNPGTPASLGMETALDGYSYSAGAVYIHNMDSTQTVDPKETVKNLSTKGIRQQVLEQYEDSHLQQAFGAKSFRYAILVCILIAFAILIGPVNLFVFANATRRHRLFFTTPIISVTASILLVLAILLSDGIGGSGMRLVHMEVIPGKENSAYLTQLQFCRTGVLLGSSFEINPSSFVSHAAIAKSPWSRVTRDLDSPNLSMELNFLAGKQQLSGEWFKSRSEHAHLLKSVVPTRGRIEITASSANSLTLLSSFDFPIQTLYYEDSSGKTWKATGLESGKAVQAVPLANQEFMRAFNEIINLADGGMKEGIEKCFDRGRFFAVSEQAPAIDTLSAIRWKKTTTVLTGSLATTTP
jgi:hypothetical protein